MIRTGPLKMGKHTPLKVMDCPKCYSVHGPILPELCNFDWREAFAYAEGFEREDVKRIIALAEGCNEGDAWIALFKLRGGEYAALNAWCDYTGWD